MGNLIESTLLSLARDPDLEESLRADRSPVHVRLPAAAATPNLDQR